jgi:UDPglucose 6-dehydrogenase
VSWGLAFKPNTDDIRNAAALEIVHLLQAEGAKIRVFDPKAMDNARKILKGAVFCDNAYTVAEGCDCLVLLTEWQEFKDLDFVQIRDVMSQAVIFDGRNFFDGGHLRDIGFEYFGIGRGKSL